MSFKKIAYSGHDHSLGQLGGGAWLNDLTLWPKDPEGKLMLPVLMMKEKFLPVPFLPEGMALTVFVSIERSSGVFKRSSLRKITVNQQSELSTLELGYSKVLMHQLSEQELIPDIGEDLITKKFIELVEFNDDDTAEELEDEDSGAGMSKVLGRAHWLQDPVYETPRYYFLAQIQDSDISKISPKHEGIFANGMGYIFADNRSRKLAEGSDCGYFFTQFT